MKFIFILFLSLIAHPIISQISYNSDSISKSTLKSVRKLEKEKVKKHRNAKYAYLSHSIKTSKKFEEFSKEASTKELIMLTNHPNPLIRCQSFKALTYRKNINLLPIVIHHVEDDSILKTKNHQSFWSYSVADYFISHSQFLFDTNVHSRLDSNQLRILDSVLIYSETQTLAKRTAIINVGPNPHFHSRIVKLAEDNNLEALTVLAKYRLESDTLLLLKKFQTTKPAFGIQRKIYEIIEEFPHSSFLPYLESKLKVALVAPRFSTDWQYLYRAISAYKNSDALVLLTIAVNSEHKYYSARYHLDFIFNAIRYHSCDDYDPLSWTLWEEYGRVTVATFKKQKAVDSTRALTYCKATLLNPRKFQSAFTFASFGDFRNSSNPTSAMLYLVLEKDKTEGLKIIQNYILSAKRRDFLMVEPKIRRIKDPSFIEPLFARLEKAWDGNVYIPIVEILLSYQNHEVNKRVLETRQLNKNLFDSWGARVLNDILKENGLIE